MILNVSSERLYRNRNNTVKSIVLRLLQLIVALKSAGKSAY